MDEMIWCENCNAYTVHVLDDSDEWVCTECDGELIEEDVAQCDEHIAKSLIK